MLWVAIHIFWSLCDDNRPHRSVSSRVPIKPNMFYVGPLQGSSWKYVGRVGSMGPCWAMLGLGPCSVVRHHCAHVEHPCWAYVGPMLKHEKRFWAYVGPMLGLCWAILSPSLATQPILGPFTKTVENTAFPRPPLTCFRITRAHTKGLGTLGTGGF